MASATLNDRDFRRLVDLIHELTGVTIEPTKRSMIASRIRRRLRAVGLDAVSDYLDLLAESDPSGDTVLDFVDAVTTHKTSFFRTPSVWEFLADEVRNREPSDGKFRLWSAASSTGEEAYSAAMLLTDILGPHTSMPGWAIEASDVSQRTVEKASQGVYDADAKEALKTAFEGRDMSSNLVRHRDGVQVRKDVATGVRFSVHNLLEKRAALYDVVMLRNVIIYFNEADTGRVVDNALACLKPNGLLVIGESESMLARGSDLEFAGPCIYRKKS